MPEISRSSSFSGVVTAGLPQAPALTLPKHPGQNDKPAGPSDLNARTGIAGGNIAPRTSLSFKELLSAVQESTSHKHFDTAKETEAPSNLKAQVEGRAAAPRTTSPVKEQNSVPQGKPSVDAQKLQAPTGLGARVLAVRDFAVRMTSAHRSIDPGQKQKFVDTLISQLAEWQDSQLHDPGDAARAV